VIRQIGAADWQRLRDARLRALEDAPHAYSSTLAGEQAFADEVWQERATPDETRAAFAVERDGRFDAIVSGFVADDSGAVHLVGMWVAPELRGAGIGGRLVEAIVDWARATGARRVCLCVESGNTEARRLYETCGFGSTDPPPSLPYEPGPGADVLVLEL